MRRKLLPVLWLCSCIFAVQAAEMGSFRFAIVGDRTGRAIPGIYEETWRQVAAGKPDFAVTVGDAIEGGNDKSAADEWKSVAGMWPKGLKIYHTPGNHDIWSSLSERLFTAFTGLAPSYSFDYHQAHFVVLDNSRTEDLSPAQLDFLRTDLEHNRGKRPLFVFFHRAYWLIPLKLGANGFVLQQLAKQYGVCCVVSGHGHQFQSLEREGVRYLEVGSSGASLERAGGSGVGYADGWFYQYVDVAVNGSSVRFDVRELGPPHGESRVKTIYAGAAAGAP